MEQQDSILLKKLGYKNTSYKSMKMFIDIINETEECIDNYSKEEIETLVNNYQSYIYVEMKMFYELGLNDIQKELNIIHNEIRDLNTCDIEIYSKVFGNNLNPTLSETIISIANYRKKQKIQEIYPQKIYLKYNSFNRIDVK